MTTYRAELNGDEVFREEVDGPGTSKVFPPELLDPEVGTVVLYVDDVIIGVQVPLAERAEQGS
jgi:hypothetical protein